MAPNGSKGLQMAPNGSKWLQMTPNDSKTQHPHVAKAFRHSLRMNAELAARAWLNFGSLVVGVQIILRVVILVFLCTFYETKKLEKRSKI